MDEEEVQARQGAGELAKYLEQKYGQDSMLMIIDEGGSAVRLFDTAFAMPATSEVCVDVSIDYLSADAALRLSEGICRHRDLGRYTRRSFFDPTGAQWDWPHE